MAKITNEELYKIQILAQPGLNDLLDKILKKASLSSGIMPNKPVPCIIYKERIYGFDGLSPKPFEREVRYARTNHDGIQAQLDHSFDRNILHLVGDDMSDLNRGRVLVAFCEIEFIVDVLICYKLGVYSGKCTYSEVLEGHFKPKHDLATFDEKREFLLDAGIISNSISSELITAQGIRNKIAHNYFLDKNIGFSDKKVAYYGSANKAIETKLNYAWLLLMQTYNNYQVEILSWSYDKVVS